MGLLSCLCCPVFAGVLKPALLEPEDELGMQPGAAATSDADARNSVGSRQESSPHGNDERSTASLLKAQTALSNVRGTCNSLPSATDESMLPPLLASHESCDAPPHNTVDVDLGPVSPDARASARDTEPPEPATPASAAQVRAATAAAHG